jgi:hypothetical protein
MRKRGRAATRYRESRVGAYGVTDHANSGGREPRAEMFVLEKHIEHETHVSRPVLEIPGRSLQTAIRAAVAQMLRQRHDKPGSGQMRRRVSMRPRSPIVAVADDDERKAFTFQRRVDGDRKRVWSEEFDSLDRARGIERPYRQADTLYNVLDGEPPTADVHR